MRLLVFSDSHGFRSVVEKALADHPEAEQVFFLGDGIRQMEEISYQFPAPVYHMVAGNCDWGSDEKLQDLVTIAGRRIFYTHGHLYQVKFGPEKLLAAGRSRSADIILYGHTHVADTKYENGLYVMNPGAARSIGGSYGIVDITTAGVALNIVKA